VLAIPPLVELNIRYARRIEETLRTYRQAEVFYQDHLEHNDIQVSQLETSLVFLKDVYPSLTADLNHLVFKSLSRLTRSLETTKATLERGLDRDGNKTAVVHFAWEICSESRPERGREGSESVSTSSPMGNPVQWSWCHCPYNSRPTTEE
jgi:hypothetical protein